MTQILADGAESFLQVANLEPSPLVQEMTEYGREQSFPIVGPDVGRFLRVLARLANAERVFEFGSGFGYSGAWFLGALPADGELVLTDYDAENLEQAESFLSRADHRATIHYEAGDAMETFEAYDGPFDVILVDHDKERYVDAFEDARDELSPGGVVVADNMMAGPVTHEDVRGVLAGESTDDEATQGVADYVEHVRDDTDFETSFVPLGSGLAVSTKKRQ
jgi:caffeoyl-CoA O-methyltransferase